MSHGLDERRNIILRDSHQWPYNGLSATEHDCRELLDQIRELIAENRMLEAGRDEARTVARELYVHNRELARDMLTLVPPVGVHEVIAQRDYAMAVCTELYELWDAETITKWYWHAEYQAVRESRDEIAEERNAARADLDEIMAMARPVVEAALAEQRVNVTVGEPAINVETFSVDLSKGPSDAGVCRCGAQTHNGVCPNGCDPKDHGEEP